MAEALAEVKAGDTIYTATNEHGSKYPMLHTVERVTRERVHTATAVFRRDGTVYGARGMDERCAKVPTAEEHEPAGAWERALRHRRLVWELSELLSNASLATLEAVANVLRNRQGLDVDAVKRRKGADDA